jgi:hypothetical protein
MPTYTPQALAMFGCQASRLPSRNGDRLFTISPTDAKLARAGYIEAGHAATPVTPNGVGYSFDVYDLGVAIPTLGLAFVDALNLSAIAPVADLSEWGWALDGPGWEAYSPTGEVRAFRTHDAAHAWRIAAVREYLGLPIADEADTDVCPIHGRGCEAWA